MQPFWPDYSRHSLLPQFPSTTRPPPLSHFCYYSYRCFNWDFMFYVSIMDEITSPCRVSRAPSQSRAFFSTTTSWLKWHWLKIKSLFVSVFKRKMLRGHTLGELNKMALKFWFLIWIVCYCHSHYTDFFQCW